MLNAYEDQSHTLALCVYQLKNPNTFKDLSKNEKGVLKLLSCKKSSDSVASVQRIIVYPGELRNVFLDRAEGAQWVGLAAGYYELDPAGATRLIKIPLEVIKKGIIFKKKYFIPNKLISRIHFGPSEISHLEEGSVAEDDTEIKEVKSKKVSEVKDKDKTGDDDKKASKESGDDDKKASKESGDDDKKASKKSDDDDEDASKKPSDGDEETAKKSDTVDKKESPASDDSGEETLKDSDDSTKESTDKEKSVCKPCDPCNPCAIIGAPEAKDDKDAEAASDAKETSSDTDTDQPDAKKKKKKAQTSDITNDSEPDNTGKKSDGEDEQAAANQGMLLNTGKLLVEDILK